MDAEKEELEYLIKDIDREHPQIKKMPRWKELRHKISEILDFVVDEMDKNHLGSGTAEQDARQHQEKKKNLYNFFI